MSLIFGYNNIHYNYVMVYMIVLWTIGINECDCHPNATCNPNTDGNYTCQCDDGYEGNGFDCNLQGSNKLNTEVPTTTNTTQPDTSQPDTSQPDTSRDADIIYGITLGATLPLLVIGILVVIICICYCAGKSSDITKKENDP